jgi:hypothetical protein
MTVLILFVVGNNNNNNNNNNINAFEICGGGEKINTDTDTNTCKYK